MFVFYLDHFDNSLVSCNGYNLTAKTRYIYNKFYLQLLSMVLQQKKKKKKKKKKRDIFIYKYIFIKKNFYYRYHRISYHSCNSIPSKLASLITLVICIIPASRTIRALSLDLLLFIPLLPLPTP